VLKFQALLPQKNSNSIYKEAVFLKHEQKFDLLEKFKFGFFLKNYQE
jgi:hypothetical protein